jgi:hypothetical protein
MIKKQINKKYGVESDDEEEEEYEEEVVTQPVAKPKPVVKAEAKPKPIVKAEPKPKQKVIKYVEVESESEEEEIVYVKNPTSNIKITKKMGGSTKKC